MLGVNPVAGAAAACVAASFGIEAIRRKLPRYSEMSISIIMSAGIGLAGVLSGFVKNSANFNSFLSVSYTHLDVYKRQTLHCPLTEASRTLINQDRIAQMKKGAILSNAARGPIVDSKALADALNSGYLRGAGVDVFEMEPPLPMDHPLLHSINTIVTPHIAFASDESMEIRAKIVFENIQKWMNKEQVNTIL